jgi:hypothetical protein
MNMTKRHGGLGFFQRCYFIDFTLRNSVAATEVLARNYPIWFSLTSGSVGSRWRARRPNFNASTEVPCALEHIQGRSSFYLIACIRASSPVVKTFFNLPNE